MQRSTKRVVASLAAMLVVTVAHLTATLHSRGQQTTKPGGANSDAQQLQQWNELESRYPIADYEAPEITDSEKRLKRLARSERHNGSALGVKGGLNAPHNSGHIIILRTDWETNIPRLPAAQSDIVLMGEILDAAAYISTDKNGVYSEFTLRVDDVLKKDVTSPLSRGELVSVERQGGRVRYPSGRVEWYRLASQSMPLPSHRYILFLKRNDGNNFSIITGYELREGRVYALDSEAGKFKVYDGNDEASFFQVVREAIAKQ